MTIKNIYVYLMNYLLLFIWTKKIFNIYLEEEINYYFLEEEKYLIFIWKKILFNYYLEKEII